MNCVYIACYFLLHKKRAYHVPSAFGASDPLANVRNVHENSSFTCYARDRNYTLDMNIPHFNYCVNIP